MTEFINQIAPKHQVTVLRFLLLLEEQWPILPRPYADLLYDGIHELRFNLSRDQVRVLYFFCYQRYIVLYHAFSKNTRKVPNKFISQVIDYREDFLDRLSKEKLEELSRAVF